MRSSELSVLWTAAQCAAADRHAIDVVGVASAVLMERAALAVTAEVQELVADRGATSVAILCGPGNNGGDGLAIARQLHHRQVPVVAFLVTSKFNDAVAEQLAWARASGVDVRLGLPEGSGESTIVVDALLGTGSTGAPRGAVGAALAWDGLHAAAGRLAVDLPSGVDPDTGATAAPVFSADCTVTLVRSKPGLHVTPGATHAGRVVVADIGIAAPPRTAEDPAATALIDPAAVAVALASVGAARHKGDRGHVGVVGGSEGYFGAPVLAAMAALRIGAGLVTVASPSAALATLAVERPEMMAADTFDAGSLPGDVLVVGPGLVREEDRRWLAQVATGDARPAVWDASGLDALPTGRGAGPRVITPHPGEAARLLSRATGGSVTGAEVQAHRVDAARTLAESFAAIVVLKGEGSLVVSADGRRVRVASSGSATLSTAGTGDVLAGAIAGLWAQGLTAFDAAMAAVHLHGLAGERRPIGTLATEVADGLREWSDSSEGLTPAALAPRRWPTLRPA